MKAQLSTTIWYATVWAGTLICSLITRRSQVQILPPPPTKYLVRGPFRLIEEGLFHAPTTRFLLFFLLCGA